MKRFYLGLIFVFVITCSGCAQFLYDYIEDELGAKEFTDVGYYVVNINSSPEDAEVYINEKFVGRTPLVNLRVDATINGIDSGYPDRQIQKWVKDEPIYIYIVKVGYKKEAERLEFIPNPAYPLDRTNLKKSSYSFVLKKEE